MNTDIKSLVPSMHACCPLHARHRFVDAYISDHRVRVIILMMNYLFQIERESKIRKHTAKQRRRFRLKYSASIVGKLMKLLKKIKLDSSYGAMVQRAVNYVLDERRPSRCSCRMAVSRCITMRLNECSATWLWVGETGCIPVAI